MACEALRYVFLYSILVLTPVRGQGQDSMVNLSTSGCQLLQAFQTTTRPLLLPPRYSMEHVRGLVSEFRYNLLDSVEIALEALNEWVASRLSLLVPERGVLSLYPTANSSSTLIGRSVTSLLEVRWWLTSVEAQVALLRAVQLVSAEKGAVLEQRISRLSRRMNLLLEVFDVQRQNLPRQILCAEFSMTVSNSQSRRAQYTSMVLRDIHRSLVRMYGAMEPCQVRSHHSGRHRVRLHCPASIFYVNVPQDIRFMYNNSQLLSP